MNDWADFRRLALASDSHKNHCARAINFKISLFSIQKKNVFDLVRRCVDFVSDLFFTPFNLFSTPVFMSKKYDFSMR